MKNLLVLSDVHYDKKNIQKIMPKFADADYVLFCGDGKMNFLAIAKDYADKIVAVNGNCDSAFVGDEQFLEIEGVKIMVTHGHKFGVKGSLFDLRDFCVQNGVDVAFFGHTHCVADVSDCGVRMINPGAVSDVFEPSYFFCTVTNGKLFGKHIEIV